MRHPRGWAAAALAGLVLAILAVAPTLAADRSVSIAGFAYSPDPVTIHVGDSVTWTNNDGVVHTATGSGFDTGPIATYDSKSVSFNKAGTYPYVCTVHHQMHGTVIVLATSGGPAPNTDTAPIDPRRDDTISTVLAALGIVMLVGTLVVDRLLRRRSV